MTDYIPREIVRDLMYHKQGPLMEYDLDEIEAADVAPVKHGRWERYWSEAYWIYFHSCSVCLASALTKDETMHDEVLSNYCPNCGAKMDLKE